LTIFSILVSSLSETLAASIAINPNYKIRDHHEALAFWERKGKMKKVLWGMLAIALVVVGAILLTMFGLGPK
jgi:hypothetical protein